MQYCSLQHWILLLAPVLSTTGCCFCFGSIPSFFPELFLYWSSVAYWAPTDLGSSSFCVLSFCLFIMFLGFSRQEYWSAISFSSRPHFVSSWLPAYYSLLLPFDYFRFHIYVISYGICLSLSLQKDEKKWEFLTRLTRKKLQSCCNWKPILIRLIRHRWLAHIRFR